MVFGLTAPAHPHATLVAMYPPCSIQCKHTLTSITVSIPKPSDLDLSLLFLNSRDLLIVVVGAADRATSRQDFLHKSLQDTVESWMGLDRFPHAIMEALESVVGPEKKVTNC